MTTTCPVLAFTPAVERVLQWFSLTYEIDTTEQGTRIRRIGLPGPGSVGDQDAWLLEALEALRSIETARLTAATGRRTGEIVRPLDEFE